MGIVEKNFKKRYIVVRDVLMVLLAFFFIILGFLFGSVNIDPNLEFQQIRNGLMAFALIIAGTYIIVQVYRKSRK